MVRVKLGPMIILLFAVLAQSSNWSYMGEFRKYHNSVFSPSPIRETRRGSFQVCASVGCFKVTPSPLRLSFSAKVEPIQDEAHMESLIDLTADRSLGWIALARKHGCHLTIPPEGLREDDPVTAWEMIHCIRGKLRLVGFERALFCLQNRDPLIQRLGVRFVKALGARS